MRNAAAMPLWAGLIITIASGVSLGINIVDAVNAKHDRPATKAHELCNPAVAKPTGTLIAAPSHDGDVIACVYNVAR